MEQTQQVTCTHDEDGGTVFNGHAHPDVGDVDGMEFDEYNKWVDEHCTLEWHQAHVLHHEFELLYFEQQAERYPNGMFCWTVLDVKTSLNCARRDLNTFRAVEARNRSQKALAFI